MATTRFKGETAGERLDLSSISDSDMLQLRHKPGTIDDADKGISKAQLLSCPFGVSDTTAATVAKVADLTDSNPDFTLVSGREVVVCFTTANTASNPTLNFAGSGAIPIYYPNGAVVGDWPADTWMHLKYFYATAGNTTIQRWILLSPLFDNVSSVGGSGKYISAIEQVNGKLGATASDIATSVTSGNGAPVSSDAVANSNAMPVNEVTSNNMHSVTSHAVAEKFKATLNSFPAFTYTMKTGYSASNIWIDYVNFNIGNLYMIQFRLRNVSGDKIGTTATAEIASSTITPLQDVYATGIEYKSNSVARVLIRTDGSINLVESPSAANGNNEFIFNICILL